MHLLVLLFFVGLPCFYLVVKSPDLIRDFVIGRAKSVDREVAIGFFKCFL